MRLPTDPRLLDIVWSQFQKPIVKFDRPINSTFPHLLTVDVPDDWPYILLAPWYDVHIGHSRHDAKLFERHLAWFTKTPYVLGWLGGDVIENASKLSVGAGVYEQDFDPNNQLVLTLTQFAAAQHKLLFTLPGNHEDRTQIMGLDISAWLAFMLKLNYYPDFCLCSIRWRGNNFRLLAHHGSGGAQTKGGQVMTARKLTRVAFADIYWMGHLHVDNVERIYQADHDQQTGEEVLREGFVIISPPYVEYFGTYAAKKMYPPGAKGLTVATLQADGRMDTSVHARGRRL